MLREELKEHFLKYLRESNVSNCIDVERGREGERLKNYCRKLVLTYRGILEIYRVYECEEEIQGLLIREEIFFSIFKIFLIFVPKEQILVSIPD